MDKCVAIIGFGQIGGSLGLSLVQLGYTVSAVDIDPRVLDYGLSIGAASQVHLDPVKGIKGAEIIVLAVPVGVIPGILRAISPHLQPGVIVTDVGSTKSGILELAIQLLPPGINFIGGHPMTGTERNGIEGATHGLFANSVYVLTPGRECSTAALERVSSLVKAIGALPVIMDSMKHDRAVGVVSHLPHLLAVALAQTAGDLEEHFPGSLALGAGSFRDGTRVAESCPRMWQDICMSNQDAILQSLQDFRSKLDMLEQAVKNKDGAVICEAFAQAASIRREFTAGGENKLIG